VFSRHTFSEGNWQYDAAHTPPAFSLFYGTAMKACVFRLTSHPVILTVNVSTQVTPYFRCKENLVQYQHHSRWVVEITHCSTHIALCTVLCIHMPCESGNSKSFRCLLQLFKFLWTVF